MLYKVLPETEDLEARIAGLPWEVRWNIVPEREHWWERFTFRSTVPYHVTDTEQFVEYVASHCLSVISGGYKDEKIIGAGLTEMETKIVENLVARYRSFGFAFISTEASDFSKQALLEQIRRGEYKTGD